MEQSSSPTKSRFMSPIQFRGLNRLGDAFIPGDGELPSFSACGCAEHVDRVLGPMPEEDRKDLLMLLGILSMFPVFVLRMFWWLLEASRWIPTPVGSFLRFLRTGLKGLVVTLYYSGETGAGYTGPSSYSVLDYKVGVYTADLTPMDDQRDSAVERQGGSQVSNPV